MIGGHSSQGRSVSMSRHEQAQRAYPDPIEGHHWASSRKAAWCRTVTKKRPNPTERILVRLPFIEIAHEDHGPDRVVGKHLPEMVKLRPAFCRSKSQVRDQHPQMRSMDFEIGVNSAPRLTAGKAQIDAAHGAHRVAREQDVTVAAVVALNGWSGDRLIFGSPSEITHLLGFGGRSRP